MSENPFQPESHSTGGWREWLGLAPRSDDRQVAAVHNTPDSASRVLTEPEISRQAKRRLLGQVTDFLIDHDLEILPFTLSIAYDCMTGGSPKLAQQILERTEKGLPVTLKWLEDASATQARDATTEAVATLVSQLEDSLADFGRTMAGARDANGSYSVALQNHVDELNSARDSDNPVERLTRLTRRMLDHTRSVASDLAASEAQIGTLQTRLDEARRLANHDHLTGLPNRRAFDELFDRETRAAKLAGEALSVAFCDIDNFKRINDTHGHPAGDRVIRYVADILGRIADARCHVARHGGEEFAVLLRGVTVADCWARLETARTEIAQKRLVNRTNDTPFGRITFSGGIADALGYRTRSAALKAADDALFAAKHAGRNRIVIAGEEPQPLREVA
ncbi:GGDEF domain-containing protein [Novosphingobium sp.]|uniref:GGDEF domain-containing protein n=1 Tax=Novosphingobium sp. TaxID=1874826 RepID=UPI0033420406